MKIIADEQIPFVKEAFSQFGQVITVAGRSMHPEDLIDADALLVRSVTPVNQTLLKNSSIQFVATATSGINHIDRHYLKQKDIVFHYAPGCNARSVAEYVISSIFILSEKNNFRLADKTLGIIGYGQVGSCVARLFTALGVHCLIHDPPLHDQGISLDFVSLEEVLTADILSLHVPLVDTGPYPTRKLINASVITALKDGCILINTSRGEVIDENALLSAVSAGRLQTVIDVWHNEPEINLELLKCVDIGTAHIAGYSLDAKIRATQMIYQAFCEHFQEKPHWCSEESMQNGLQIKLECNGSIAFHDLVKELAMKAYNVTIDDQLLRESFKTERPGYYFDCLRKSYRFRREFPALSFHVPTLNKHELSILETIGFSII